MKTAKQIVQDVIARLVDDCGWNEFEYQLHVRRKVEDGLRAIEEGRVHTAEEVRSIVRDWRAKKGSDSMPTVKSVLQDLVAHLPDDCTWDDVHYQVYVAQSVMEGIADIDAGRTISQDEMERRVGHWFRSSNEGKTRGA